MSQNGSQELSAMLLVIIVLVLLWIHFSVLIAIKFICWYRTTINHSYSTRPFYFPTSSYGGLRLAMVDSSNKLKHILEKINCYKAKMVQRLMVGIDTRGDKISNTPGDEFGSVLCLTHNSRDQINVLHIYEK